MQFAVEEPGQVIHVGQLIEHPLSGSAPGRGGGLPFDPQGEAWTEDVIGQAVECSDGDGGQQREAPGGSPHAGEVGLGFVEGKAAAVAAVIEAGRGRLRQSFTPKSSLPRLDRFPPTFLQRDRRGPAIGEPSWNVGRRPCAFRPV